MKMMYEHFNGINTHIDDVREAMTSSVASMVVSPDDCGVSSWCYSDVNNTLHRNIDNCVKYSPVEELIYPLKKIVNKFPNAYTKFHHVSHNFGRDMNFPKWDRIYTALAVCVDSPSDVYMRRWHCAG